ncbi:MAG: cadherin-like domain-containing protein, partial [Chloroflexi bacterium]|nr:cadherin-like domain-containing protein [Chloroflexota bacterium]
MTTRMIMRLAGLFAVMIIYSVLSSFAFTPSSEAAEGTVTRVPKFTTVAAGDELTFEIKPTGVGGLYAVKETLGDLVLVSDTADNFEDGTFIMIQSNKFEYVVKVPENAQPCDKFEITGTWWSDPNNKFLVDPDPFIFEVTPCDDPPVDIEAFDDNAQATTGVSKTIDVVANDDGNALKVIDVTDPDHGTTAIVGDHTVSYKSESGYVGADTFQYTIKDSNDKTDTATVNVTVSPVATGTAPFKLLPASSEQPIGKKFKIQIWTNAASNQEIAGVEVYLDFDQTRLQVVDWDSTQNGVQIKPISTSLNTPFKNDVDNNTGKIKFASGILVTPYPTGTFLVAEITFQGIQVSPQPTKITFSFEPGRFTIASVSGIAIPGQPENASVVLTPVKLVGIVQLEGGARPNPEGWVIPITVKFFEPGMDTPI